LRRFSEESSKQLQGKNFFVSGGTLNYLKSEWCFIRKIVKTNHSKPNFQYTSGSLNLNSHAQPASLDSVIIDGSHFVQYTIYHKVYNFKVYSNFTSQSRLPQLGTPCAHSKTLSRTVGYWISEMDEAQDSELCSVLNQNFCSRSLYNSTLIFFNWCG
jgi:hypothetical protein